MRLRGSLFLKLLPCVPCTRVGWNDVLRLLVHALPSTASAILFITFLAINDMARDAFNIFALGIAIDLVLGIWEIAR